MNSRSYSILPAARDMQEFINSPSSPSFKTHTLRANQRSSSCSVTVFTSPHGNTSSNAVTVSAVSPYWFVFQEYPVTSVWHFSPYDGIAVGGNRTHLHRGSIQQHQHHSGDLRRR